MSEFDTPEPTECPNCKRIIQHNFDLIMTSNYYWANSCIKCGLKIDIRSKSKNNLNIKTECGVYLILFTETEPYIKEYRLDSLGIQEENI